MPLIKVFFIITALLQLVTLLRILRNFLVAASEKIFYNTTTFQEKRILWKTYVISAWNDCYEILSLVLTLQVVFLSSSLPVVGWWDMIETYHKPIFNVTYKNRKMMPPSNFKRTSQWKFQSHNIQEDFSVKVSIS